jgi:flagellin-like protein
MKLKQFFTDDDAVSPVIGVILMVAITVILAAVIASFVLGLGDSTNTTPSASFDFDYDGTDVLEITHESGDKISASQLSIAGDVTVDDVTPGTTNTNVDTAWPTDVSAGNTLTLNSVNSDFTVRVVYTAGSGDSSSTLATWNGPDA